MWLRCSRRGGFGGQVTHAVETEVLPYGGS